MLSNAERAQLPPSELGNNRCIEVATPGHGDVVIKVWSGDLDHDYTIDDRIAGKVDTVTRFQMMHGSEEYIIAALIGFARRVEMPDVSQVFLRAGQVAIEGAIGRRGVKTTRMGRFLNIVDGTGFPQFDIPAENLQALMPPIGVNPGSQISYSSFYFTDTLLGPQLALCGLRGNGDIRELHVVNKTQFVMSDLAVIAGLTCAIAKGEYQINVADVLQETFTVPEIGD